MSSFTMPKMARMTRAAFASSAPCTKSPDDGGDDLPGEAEFILKPAALARPAAVDEFVPVVIDLGLVLTLDDEGDGRGEGELRAAIERVKLLVVQLEGDGHDGAFLAGAGVGVAGDGAAFGVLEDGEVELHCFFRAVVEPEEGG